jgi:hypothetical protein
MGRGGNFSAAAFTFWGILAGSKIYFQKGALMTPAVVAEHVPLRPHIPNRTWDRVFFTAMIVVCWATVLFGFSKTYFMAGMVTAPLPNRLIHFHGAAFTLWMVLLVVQTTLITTKNVKVHRALGMYGFGLAVAMVGLGLFAAVDALKRGSAPLGLDALTFFIIPITAVLVFAVLVFYAYRMRSKPELHKRLILLATITLMDAAIGRWPVAFLQAHPPAQDLVILAFLVALAAFDLLQLHRLSKATIWGSLLIIVVHLTRVPLGQTAFWHSIASFFLKT